MNMINNRKRCVRFSEKNQIRTVERLNPDDIWFTVKEVSMSQQNYRSSIIEMHEDKGNNHLDSLSRLYFYCRAEKADAKSVSSEIIIANLAIWSDRRGLEFYASKLMCKERMQQKRILTRAIMKSQRRMKEEGIKLEDRDDVLAMVAEKLAIPAKAFARTLGQIDAILSGNQKRNLVETKKTVQKNFEHPSKRMRFSVPHD